MQSIFTPAVNLMNRLKYPQKFIVVSLVLLIPLVIVLIQYLNTTAVSIGFSSKEQAGVQFNEPLFGFLQQVQRHRAVTVALAAGQQSMAVEVTNVQSAVEQAIKNVDAQDEQIGARLNASKEWGSLKLRWQLLKDGYTSFDAQKNFDEHTAYIRQIVDFIVIIGNNSNLILDPDLDTYYYMDLGIVKLPILSEYLSQLHAYGALVGEGRDLPPQARAFYAIYGGLARSVFDSSLRSFRYSHDYNPVLAARMGTTVVAYELKVKPFLESLVPVIQTGDAPPPPGSTLSDPPQFAPSTVDAAASVDQIFTLYQKTSSALRKLIDTRVDNLTVRRNLTIFIALLSLIAALFLLVGFAQSVRTSIASMKEFTRHLVEGNMSNQLVLANQDELSEVAVSFNNIAHELTKTRDEALEASKAKSAFLANMSHELRTPLNAVIGYAELLEEEAEDSDGDWAIPDLKKIQSSARHLLALINDILDLSKIEAGKMEIYLETIDVSKMITDIQTMVKPLVEKKNNQLVVDYPKDIGQMRGDQTKTRQILFNLLSNASKFTENGKIALTVRRHEGKGDDWMTFTVQDSGIGMNAEQLSKLFKEFSQADSSTTRKYGGTGLGLAISKRFAAMMNGDIEVESALGSGSTFSLTLPVALATPEIIHLNGKQVIGQPMLPASSSTILIIDDDPTAREVLSRYLVREGYRVEQSVDGEAGIRKARAIRPDVITLDVMMPGIDGWSVLAQLKADAELRDIPVIMTSMVSDQNLGIALGAAEYLVKPVDRERLLEVLARYRGHGQNEILVLEDDLALREMMVRVLTKEGMTVTEAENGLIGLQKVAARQPNLIFLDLMMPEMNGFDFLSELRKTENGRAIPVIVVTAMELSNEQRQLLNGQVQSVVQKGAYQGDTLLAEIRSLVATHIKPIRARTPTKP